MCHKLTLLRLTLSKLVKLKLTSRLEVLKKSNQIVCEAIDKFIKKPDREVAFKMAYELENSAGELHFQQFMEKDVTDDVGKIFQNLIL